MIEWLKNNTIKISTDRKNKKITGTKFASVLGKNPWTSSFATWCEITHTYEEPYTETKYTAAGKYIEPKQAQFMKETFGMFNLVTPEEMYGEDYFNKTHGDFFPDNDIFGGMWDYILKDDNGAVKAVLEMKTTRSKNKWGKNPPFYYTLQAALYAYLLKVDSVYLVVTYLSDDDYDNLDTFTPNLDNTFVYAFSMKDKFIYFEAEYILPAINWWNKYVVSGVSPSYTKKDEKIINYLKNIDIRDKALSYGNEFIFFDNPSFDSCIIGMDIQHKSIVYSYEKMIEYYKQSNDVTYEEAKQFVDNNPVALCSFLENPPTVIFNYMLE